MALMADRGSQNGHEGFPRALSPSILPLMPFLSSVGPRLQILYCISTRLIRNKDINGINGTLIHECWDQGRFATSFPILETQLFAVPGH